MPPSSTPRNSESADADEADRQRGPRRQHQPRPDVAAELVGAEQEERILRLAAVEPDQVAVGLEQAEQLIGIAFGEQDEVAPVGRVGRVGQLEGAQVALALERVDVRPGSCRSSSNQWIACGGM